MFGVQDVLSADASEAWKWDWNRVKIEIWSQRWSSDWQTVRYFLFYWNFIVYFFFVTLVSVPNGSSCYYWGFLRWHRWLYNCVIAFCVTVQLCRTGYIFRQSRKAFLNNDSSYYVCPLGLPSTWNRSAPTAQSRAPTLTLILLMWRIGWAPNNASRWQMGFNSAFKGLTCQFFEPLA